MRSSRSGALPALALAAALAGCASGGNAVRVDAQPAAPAVASDPTAQAALERACYGCHASGYGLSGRDRLAFSYWFRGGAREKLDFSRWEALGEIDRRTLLSAVAASVRKGEMPPWDSRFVDRGAKLSAAEHEALARLAP